MAGDVQCQWAAWFRSHFTAYTKSPSDFHLATWTVEHNKCLDQLCTECTAQSSTYFKETQNKFTVRRKEMTIEGVPDLIVLEKDKSYTVYDVKTGQPKNSDVIQVMLYMSFLPYSTSGIYKGKTINGCVTYKNGEKTPVPPDALSETFQGQISHFLNILDRIEQPKRIPSYLECRYCDITSQDCADRIESETIGGESIDLPL
jgi:hypothetical protein